MAAAVCALPSFCQDSVPLYRATVIERTIDAINYQYRSGPTKIDFRGTVLLPASKGDATVDSGQGRTDIHSNFEGLEPPQRFGAEYLTYVLWAVTPDGGAHNLGEIVPNGSNRAHLPVTTGLQAFGLIVTAEPYAAVRHPSDVVVMENRVRPDTVGEIQPVLAKTELMPRGQYTWNVPAGETAGMANAPKVSMSRYQAILEIYETENALGIASTAGAEKYAPDVFAKARQELAQAQQLQQNKGSDELMVQHARAATEIAEDARAITDRRKQDEAMAAVHQQTIEAQQARQQAEAAAETERERADTAEAQAQIEHEARERAERNAQVAREQSEQAAIVVAQPIPAPLPEQAPQPDRRAAAREMRAQLLQQMNSMIVSRDTPRGLVATLDDSDFDRSQLRLGPVGAVSRLAVVLIAHPGLKVSVEGYSDTPEGSEFARKRADAVAGALMRAGVPAQQVSTEDLGDSRPLVSNETEQGRMENRRVEIVISGDAIGTMPSWDQSYPLSFNRR
jgi:flagellar motor protein MotB